MLFGSADIARADSVRDREWHLTALKIEQVHRVSRGAGVTVAVIDTGVDAGHRDLAGAVRPGIDLLPDPIGDGRDDLDGHGTSMAGLIAARGHGSGDGILGIAPAAKVLPIRAGIGGYATSAYLTKAIAFAKKNGARVVNMSFGTADDTPLREAVRAAQAADMVLIASAGNKGSVGDNYPGMYPEVLAVGATDERGNIGRISVTGPHVDLTAPGVDIATIGIHGSRYGISSGTSDATAIVSGAAALVRAKYPELSAAEVVHRLTATATDAGEPGRDDTYGYGRLNLLKALTADVPAAAPSVSAGGRVDAAPRAPDSDAETRRVSPLLVGGLAVAGVLLLGGLVVGLLVLLRRRD
ncbi:type VII secretion-associated serine protease mycosin [Nucisporomicrobium flavum]|uniref:type VII secretion-associated serine protease mycosin n=1 Tax=Nucisporomicrobium flavum TaxID=2785915 RepID=UPI0018F485DA|nr:type VII secretion-associated serine protease mycosin [Nucisporomicrobium flavum]